METDSVNNFPHYCCFNAQYPQFKIVLKFHNNAIHTFSDAEKHGPKSIPFELRPKHTVLLLWVQAWSQRSKCWDKLSIKARGDGWGWGSQETPKHSPPTHAFFFFLCRKQDQNDVHHGFGESLKVTSNHCHLKFPSGYKDWSYEGAFSRDHTSFELFAHK